MTQAASKRKNSFAEHSTEVALIACVLLAIYVLLCLLSYSSSDPSWSSTGDGSPSNIGGRFGANLADLLMHGFGYFAYIAPILLLLAGFKLYKRRNEMINVSYQRLAIIFAGFVMTVLGASSIESLHFGHLSAKLVVPY